MPETNDPNTQQPLTPAIMLERVIVDVGERLLSCTNEDAEEWLSGALHRRFLELLNVYRELLLALTPQK